MTTLVGVAVIAAPLALVSWLLLRRHRPLLLLAFALSTVGLGYLVATGAADDIGRRIWPKHAVKAN